MPNRREPLTYTIVDHLYYIAYTVTSLSQNDCSDAALSDWLFLGMQTGMRKSEWCQDRYIVHKTQKVLKKIDGSLSAFTFSVWFLKEPEDIEFQARDISRFHMLKY